MPLGIDVVACPGSPGTVGNCGAFACPRRYELDDDDPCPQGEGVFVQKLTLCATCNECQGDLDEPDCFTIYEEVPVAPKVNLTDPTRSVCDTFGWGGCGDGSKGTVTLEADVRYFCLDNFPNSKNPFEGAPSGPVPVSFVTCPCLTGWSTQDFRYRIYTSEPSWWNNDRARTTRSATTEWDCCEGPSQSVVNCT